jgi:outer membrane protein assembly factor BamB
MLRALLRLVAAVAALAGNAPGAQAADWPTYHGDNARTGVASSPPLGQLSRAWSAKLDGQVYASPLIARGRVIVATENNSVYAFDAQGKRLWRQHVGTPASASSLACAGNIDPSGITGTPVVDLRRGTVYAVAFLQSVRHQLVAIDLKTGKLRWRRGIDGKGTDPKAQQERGALVISHGRVYVPFGGLFGDCGNFRGVIASRTLRGRGLRTFKTPAPEAGIWAPGGPTVDSAGNLFAATGNGGGNGYGFASSVVRLTPTLRATAHWAPRDWQALSRSDTDVGSVQPTLLPGGLVFQSGKNGVGYLLPKNLGGIAGELFSAPVCSSAFGGNAYKAPFIYVPCAGSLTALRVQGQRFSVAWRRTGFDAGPPIVAGGAVWTIERGGGKLRAFDPVTGRDVTSVDLGDAISFPTPAAAGSLLVAPAGDSVVALRGL